MAFRGSGLDALLNRPEEESAWMRFFSSPVKFLAEHLYHLLEFRFDRYNDSTGIRVVCVSDTHNAQPILPDGDVLVHAGDLTQSGSLKELKEQIEWLDKQPHRYKIVIAGSHDLYLDHRHRSNASTPDNTSETTLQAPEPVDWRSLSYLQNTSMTLNFGPRQFKVFGSPHAPKHGNRAFGYSRAGPDPWEGSIPADTDILVTHGPPKSHLDCGRWGCQYLLRSLWSMKKKPLLHIFGHVHGGYGQEMLRWDWFQETYERIMSGDPNWVALIRLVYFGLFRIIQIFVRPKGNLTLLVNAAAIGGLRDEKRREAIYVVI